MKIYEKPMAMIENIELEDVMTTSGEETAELVADLMTETGADNVIVFEW